MSSERSTWLPQGSQVNRAMLAAWPLVKAKPSSPFSRMAMVRSSSCRVGFCTRE